MMTIIFRKLKFPYMKIKKSNKLSYVVIQRQKVLNNSDMISLLGQGKILSINITSSTVEIKNLPSFFKNRTQSISVTS